MMGSGDAKRTAADHQALGLPSEISARQSIASWLSPTLGSVIMSIVFFALLTPIGLVMRLLGYDPLRLHLERGASSYWVVRRVPLDRSRTSITRQS